MKKKEFKKCILKTIWEITIERDKLSKTCSSTVRGSAKTTVQENNTINKLLMENCGKKY